jgi:ribosomal protein S18 acetylase RimI-like enzyme
VDSKYQGKGIATALIKKGERELLKKGISQYYLQVFVYNEKAIRLYKKIGFDIIDKFNVNNKEKYLMKKRVI